MKFFCTLKYFKKNSKENKEVNNIVKKLPSTPIIARDILNLISNNTTRVIFDKDIKNSYYIFLKDKIYISSNEKNNDFKRCLLVAHECRHSIQSKLLQKINFIFSNIELVLFALTIFVLAVLKITKFRYIYFLICILSMIPRLYLELDAIIESLKISNNYVRTKLEESEAKKLNDIYTSLIKLLLPFSLIALFLGKIIRMVITLFLSILK